MRHQDMYDSARARPVPRQERGVTRRLGLGAITILAAGVGLASHVHAQEGELRVRVVRTDGSPATDARVRVLGLGRVADVTDNGRITFARVPAGNYLLEAASQRFGRGLGRVQLAPDGIEEVEITVSLFFHGDEIVVSAGQDAVLSEVYTPASVRRGIELRAGAEGSLGESLDDEPGVNSSYFGPGSSRPVIRGLSADRVRVLESGVGSGDLSSTSPDHPPAVEAAQAERIEIIRGPATLLYGGSAIGGVVNIEDGRVPKELPAHPLTGSILLRGGTVADERNAGFRLNGAVGRVAYHVDGLFRETDDYAIPGFAARDPDPADPGEEGVLRNSALETWRAAAGLSFVSNSGFAGVSLLGFDSNYGVPGSVAPVAVPGGGGAEEEGDVSVDLQQRRIDFEGGWRFGGTFIKGLKARLGSADYRHFEVVTDPESGASEVETRFMNDEWEARLEVQNEFSGQITGAFGAQYRNRDFEAIGDEVFVPPTETEQFGFFAFEQLSLGPVKLQGGARYERQATADLSAGSERDDTGISASLGIAWQPHSRVTLAVNGSRSVKLPSPEELFSEGPHLATAQFEVGDPDLIREVGYSLDLAIRLVEGPVRGELTVFANSFDDFIFQAFTGEVMEGLPVLLYSQEDALFTGLEGRAEAEVFHTADGHVTVEAWGDYVRAELTATDRPLPRIPPVRVGTGVNYEGSSWHGHLGFTRVTRQDRVFDFETPSDGFSTVDASIGRRIFSGRVVHDLVLAGTNLTDQEARNHVSFLKNAAPLPGREVRLVYQMTF